MRHGDGEKQPARIVLGRGLVLFWPLVPMHPSAGDGVRSCFLSLPAYVPLEMLDLKHLTWALAHQSIIFFHSK